MRGIAPDVLKAFEGYFWPGNVRELENCIERMMVLGDADILSSQHLPLDILKGTAAEGGLTGAASQQHASNHGGANAGGMMLPPEGVVLENLEADLMRQALERSEGRIEPAAQLLGISYKTLQYRIRKYELKEWQHEIRRGEVS